MRELPVPAHFHPARVGEIYRVDYQAVAEAGMHLVRSDQPMASWPGLPVR